MHASSAPDEPGRGTRPGVTWKPFGIPDSEYDQAPARDGTRVLNLSLRRPREAGDRSATWLRCAMLALGLLAAAAAAVSFQAQFKMVFAAKGVQWVAALEAAIPDAAAMVFACLGIALALHRRRAIRARVLNVGAVATSVTMNALAAGPGWRDWAIWIMPPVAYALASDTLIGVVRAHAIAQQRESGEALADDDATPLAVLTGVLLWVLRLTLAPASTLTGFRGWVLEECPVAPGRRAEVVAITPPVTEEIFPCPACRSVVALPDGSCASCGWPQEPDTDRDSTEYCPDCQAVLKFPADSCAECGWKLPELCHVHTGPISERPWAGPCLQTKPCPLHPQPEAGQHRDGSKTSRFLALVEEQHGPLSAIDPSKVSRISSELAPLVDLHAGSARKVLGKRVRATQNGHSS
jgi:hypothetical protein